MSLAHAIYPTTSSRPPIGVAARVLVVDDIEDNRDILVRRLTRMGIADIIQAADGRAALEIIRETPLDLVLLDIMMPVMTGFDVLESLAAEERMACLPVIVISAMNEMSAVTRAISLGAEDFLLKPFDPVLLRARIIPCLEKKHLRDRVHDELMRKKAELSEARNLQLALTPRRHAGDAFAIDAVLQPALEIGGDLVDHVPLADGRHLLVVGDVSDKGAGAALVMARTHALIRGLASRAEAATTFHNLGAVAQALNRELARDNHSCMFVTMLMALFDPHHERLDYLRCGHVPPFLRHADGRVERLEERGGLPLGVSEEATYFAAVTEVRRGDRLLIVSDGVTEAFSPDGTPFDDRGVVSWLEGPPAPLSDLVRRVRGHEAGQAPSDDLAALFLIFDDLPG